MENRSYRKRCQKVYGDLALWLFGSFSPRVYVDMLASLAAGFAAGFAAVKCSATRSVFVWLIFILISSLSLPPSTPAIVFEDVFEAIQ